MNDVRSMRFDSDDVTKPGHPSASSNLKNIFGKILPSAIKTNELERKYDYLNDRLETQLRILVHIFPHLDRVCPGFNRVQLSLTLAQPYLNQRKSN